jgi:tetratricopeptide (TPR) repeat protein
VWGGAALVVVLFMLVVLSLRQVSSSDIGFHLKGGEFILSGQGWPRNDPFTFTLADHPYVDTSWGYQVLLAVIHRAFGAAGVVLSHTTLLIGLFLMIVRTARLVPAEPTAVAILGALGVLASEMRFEARPELLSYLLLAVVLHILHRHAEGLASPLWLLPIIHLVWANVHGLFALGWVAEACFVAGLLARDRRLDLALLGWTAASVAGAFVNPYGWKGALFPLTLATRLEPGNPFAQSIGEFASPFAMGLSERFPFYPRLPVFSFRAFAAVSLAALIGAVRSRRFHAVLLWLVFAALAFRMIRNMPLLIVAVTPPTAWWMSTAGALRSLGVRSRSRGWLQRAAIVGVAATAIVVSLRVFHDAYYLASRREDRFGVGWNRGALPIEAAEWARRTGLRGPVLNHLNFGGWLMWSLQEPVFIDGRLEVVGEEFYEGYRRALASTEALETTVSRYGIRWLIFPYAISPDLLGRVSRDARWQLIYADGLAAAFGRADSRPSAPVAAALPLLTVPTPPLRALPGLGGPARRRGLAHWLSGVVRREEFPREDYGLGLFHLYRGELVEAEARFARAIERSGGAYYEIYNNLGAVLYRMKRVEDARRCYRVVLEDDPSSRVARERLGERRDS